MLKNHTPGQAFCLFFIVLISGCKKESFSYEQCVLDAIKGNVDQRLMHRIELTCKMQDIRQGTLDPILIPSSLSNVDGTLWHRKPNANNVTGYVEATFYNDNPYIYVTSINIKVNYSLAKLLNLDREENINEVVHLDVSIPPYGSQTLKFNTRKSQNIRFEFNNWSIISARGIRIKENIQKI